MERETGIEPATNSLEGCDSTTELLPPPRFATSLTHRSGGQARRLVALRSLRRLACYNEPVAPPVAIDGCPPRVAACPPQLARSVRAKRVWRGKDSNLRSPEATDLQS